MNQIDPFNQAIKDEMAVVLATSADGSVTMRLVSPVNYHGDVLIFTHASSRKYQQLQQNPNCCISAGGFFAEAKATFCGATMLDKNQPMREAYAAKFAGAFDEGVTFGGRNAEFLLLHPTALSGWTFENDTPTADGIPNVPFQISM